MRRPKTTNDLGANLFDRQAASNAPLADRVRPTRLAEIVGQEHLLGPGKLLSRAIETDRIPSMVLWGPPGTGKTSLAQVIANETRARFVAFSAVLGGLPELRAILAEAREQNRLGRKTILFIDEIHRFNKAQQDALLPHAEKGTVVLIGATTENPSFAVNAALLSRVRVFRLEPLSETAIESLLQRALADEARGLQARGLKIQPHALEVLATHARGDARRALDVLEVAADYAGASEGSNEISIHAIEQALASKTLLYDKSGEEHYNVVSAFIKSMRGTDPDGAIYWMMRMLEAGDDPLFVLRRMIIFASEDIGNADPQALQVAVAADLAFRRLGMPEGMFPLAQCCLYLATAPKSNASYRAWTAAQADVQEQGGLPVPMTLRNAPTTAMKQWGYGQGYRYPHDEGGYAEGQVYLPEKLVGRVYYQPTESGAENRIRERLEGLRTPKQASNDPSEE